MNNFIKKYFFISFLLITTIIKLSGMRNRYYPLGMPSETSYYDTQDYYDGESIMPDTQAIEQEAPQLLTPIKKNDFQVQIIEKESNWLVEVIDPFKILENKMKSATSSIRREAIEEFERLFSEKKGYKEALEIIIKLLNFNNFVLIKDDEAIVDTLYLFKIFIESDLVDFYKELNNREIFNKVVQMVNEISLDILDINDKTIVLLLNIFNILIDNKYINLIDVIKASLELVESYAQSTNVDITQNVLLLLKKLVARKELIQKDDVFQKIINLTKKTTLNYIRNTHDIKTLQLSAELFSELVENEQQKTRILKIIQRKIHAIFFK